MSCCPPHPSSSLLGRTGCPLGKPHKDDLGCCPLPGCDGLQTALLLVRAEVGSGTPRLMGSHPVPTVPCRSNASSALQTQQGEQPVSATQLADSLLAQLGHLPSKLNSSGNLVAVAAQGAAAPPKSSAPELQLSHHRRPSAPEQYHFVRPSSEHAAAAQHLRTSGCFSMQFLEPPNSQAASGQLVHPMLSAHASGARVSASAASEKSHTSLASMPHDTSLIKAGVPMINSHGVSQMQGRTCSTCKQQDGQGLQGFTSWHIGCTALSVSWTV